MKVELYAPAKYWACDSELLDRITTGCGPGKFGDFLVPDTMYGLSVKQACRIHDFYYSPMMPATHECKKEADRVFLNNMIRIIKAKTRWKILRLLRTHRARVYYLAVKHFGGPAFWNAKNEESNIRTVDI